jgi:hypothetical protein
MGLNPFDRVTLNATALFRRKALPATFLGKTARARVGHPHLHHA